MWKIIYHRQYAAVAATLLTLAGVAFAPTSRAADDAVAREIIVFSGVSHSVSVEDADAREFTVFAGHPGPAPVVDAVAREITIFAGSLSPIAMDDVAAREFTIFSGTLEPWPVADSIAREFSVLVIEPPEFSVTDAVAREFVVHVPAPPQITLAESTLQYTEGDGAVAIDPLAAVFDPDTLDFGGGELRVELIDGASPGDQIDIGHHDPAAEILIEDDRVLYQDEEIATFTGGGGLPLSVFFDPGTGIDPVVAVVRHIRFANTQRFPDAGIRAVEFKLSDTDVGFGPSATREIQVIPVNHPPIAGPDFIGVEMDTPMDIPDSLLLSNDSDPDGDAITFALPDTVTAAGGTLVLEDGVVSYTPPAGFIGTDRFDYQLSDPFGGVANGQVSLFVFAPDDPSAVVLDMAFEAPGGAFVLKAIGLPDRSYHLLASPDLMVWSPVASVLSDAFGAITVIDPDAPDHPKRFYTFSFATGE